MVGFLKLYGDELLGSNNITGQGTTKHMVSLSVMDQNTDFPPLHLDQEFYSIKHKTTPHFIQQKSSLILPYLQYKFNMCNMTYCFTFIFLYNIHPKSIMKKTVQKKRKQFMTCNIEQLLCSLTTLRFKRIFYQTLTLAKKKKASLTREE